MYQPLADEPEMRILGFSYHWKKLDRDTFTTFRLPRRDKDWQLGEEVQVVIRPRSKTRELMGPALITQAEANRVLGKYAQYFTPPYSIITEGEATEDGFSNLTEMLLWLFNANRDRIFESKLTKLTLKWTSCAPGGSPSTAL